MHMLVFQYMFSAFTTSSVLAIRRSFSGAETSLKDETRLLLLRVGSLVTLHIPVFAQPMYIYIYI